MIKILFFIVFLISANAAIETIENESQRIIVCEDNTMTIKCSNYSRIKINYVNYGRRSTTVCPKKGVDRYTKCSASGALQIVTDICDNKISCLVYIGTQTFGDPCFNTFKYIDVDYVCTTTACEGSTLKISCPNDDTRIKIINAMYGQQSLEICSKNDYNKNPNLNANAHSNYRSNATEVMAISCDDEKSCTVPVNNVIFVAPNYGTHKYIQVNYQCRKIHNPHLTFINPVAPMKQSNCYKNRKKTVCENNRMTISCPKNTEIQIDYVNYGRTSKTVCPKKGIDQFTQCRANNALQIVTDICNNKMTCSVYIGGETFGDPCYNTYKYIDVYYHCSETSNKDSFQNPCNEYKEEIVCEDDTMTMFCPKNFEIQVSSVNFGRTSRDVCPRGGLDENIHCHSDRAAEIVTNRCNHATMCSIYISTKIFGDPCYSTYKYIEVDYQCSRKVDDN